MARAREKEKREVVCSRCGGERWQRGEKGSEVGPAKKGGGGGGGGDGGGGGGGHR